MERNANPSLYIETLGNMSTPNICKSQEEDSREAGGGQERGSDHEMGKVHNIGS